MQGTSGFSVTSINPATVSLNGASPIAEFTRHFPHSEFLNETFVFVGKDINLPAGYTTATFTAQTYSGQQITSSKQVLNIPFSAKVPGRLHFLMDKGTTYPGLRRLEKVSPGSVNLGNTTQPLPASVKVNLTSQRGGPAISGSSYRDQVSTTGTTTPGGPAQDRCLPRRRPPGKRLAVSTRAMEPNDSTCRASFLLP